MTLCPPRPGTPAYEQYRELADAFDAIGGVPAAGALARPTISEERMRTLVDRFLSWPLPASVCSDTCVSDPTYPHRSGTNLLTATEARQMLEHVLGIG